MSGQGAMLLLTNHLLSSQPSFENTFPYLQGMPHQLYPSIIATEMHITLVLENLYFIPQGSSYSSGLCFLIFFIHELLQALTTLSSRVSTFPFL